MGVKARSTRNAALRQGRLIAADKAAAEKEAADKAADQAKAAS
jgi:hypothetical protein